MSILNTAYSWIRLSTFFENCNKTIAKELIVLAIIILPFMISITGKIAATVGISSHLTV